VASSRLDGPVGDVGCGPGHVAAHLAARGLPVVGIDLSPAMIEVARRRQPGLDLRVGTMTRLDTPDASWAGLAAVYSIIHLPRADRERAYTEMARVLHPGARVPCRQRDGATARPGDSIHLDEFLGRRVDLDGYFVAPDEVAAGLTAAGIRLEARFDREPLAGPRIPEPAFLPARPALLRPWLHLSHRVRRFSSTVFPPLLNGTM
jgi:SAM-dependent methyltransferase